ncbi:uncharacterized protein RSE6_07292 [Rhynchosporium secalis]|uniref:Uncharacterized protein n=1 Tax=Rhynchosporium secalis TaxID=38038 RepID=A0A1E1MCK1_RHYSE|nr:uncharacterized protein RSE6_07292 [Rhynchosporium secalis]
MLQCFLAALKHRSIYFEKHFSEANSQESLKDYLALLRDWAAISIFGVKKILCLRCSEHSWLPARSLCAYRSFLRDALMAVVKLSGYCSSSTIFTSSSFAHSTDSAQQETPFCPENRKQTSHPKSAATMSKDIRGFFSKIKSNFNYQLRIDAGELLNGRFRMIYLQVNSQAKSTKLKEWIRKHGTHANLASARFDTLAEDLETEAENVLEELEAAAKNKI